MNYPDFIKSKAITTSSAGIDVPAAELNPLLFDFQRDIVRWALAKGKAAIFADCGDGKTAMQLEWAISTHTPPAGCDPTICEKRVITPQEVDKSSSNFSNKRVNTAFFAAKSLGFQFHFGFAGQIIRAPSGS